MNCRKCGNLLNENDPICRVCGEPVNMGTPITNQVNQGTNNQGYVNGVQTPTQPMNNEPVVNQQTQPVMNQQVPVQPMTNQNYGPQEAPTQMQNPNNNYNNVQPSMPMNQNYGNMVPPVNNGMNPNQMPQNTKNSNKGFIIILIVLIFIIAGLGGFIAYKTITDKTETKEIDKKPDDKKEDDNKPSQDDDDKDDDDDKGDDNKPSDKNTHLLNGFTFVLPDGLIYNKTNDSITATDSVSSANLYFNFFVENYSYATALASINEIVTELTTEGFTVLNHGKIKYSNTEFYAFIVSKDGDAGVSYLASLDTTHVASGFVMGVTEQNIDTAFEKIAYMIENSSSVEGFAPSENEDKFTGLKGKDEFKSQTIKGATYTIK